MKNKSNPHLLGGVIKRPNGTFSVTPRMPLGVLDAGQLETIAVIIKKFKLPGIRANTAQRISIEGIPAQSLDQVVKMLNGIGDLCPQSITACRGLGECKHGLQDTQSMAMKIDKILRPPVQMPAHLKFGLSGCPRCCGQSYVKDFGLIGTGKGWTLIFGGASGRKVRCGDEIITGAPGDQVLEQMKLILSFYIENAAKKERTAKFAERLGIDFIKRNLM
jgi:NAD(P)H-nitrite reductase large subunit